MTTILKYLFLFIGISCPAQTITNLNDVNNHLLYRFHHNIIMISADSGLKESDYTLDCIDCVITKKLNSRDTTKNILPENTFNIDVERSRAATLLIIRNDKDTVRHEFKVMNVPDPILSINDIRSEEPLNVALLDSAIHLFALYPRVVSLVNSFEIINWEVSTTEGQRVLGRGEGNRIPHEVTQLIKQLKSGETLSLLCSVLDETGIWRKKSGSFVIVNE